MNNCYECGEKLNPETFDDEFRCESCGQLWELTWEYIDAYQEKVYFRPIGRKYD